MPLAPSPYDFTINFQRIKQDKHMSCWYAAAQMVLGSRDIVKSIVFTSTNLNTLIRYVGNKGLIPKTVTDFASEVGLSSDQSVFSSGFSAENYSTYLKKLGPLWLAGKFPQGGHVVVICGVIGDKVMVADPDGSQPFPKWMALSEVEAVRTSYKAPLLYRVNGPTR